MEGGSIMEVGSIGLGEAGKRSNVGVRGDAAKRPNARGGAGNALVHYDAEMRRLWVCGRRLHHGLTGAVLAAAGVLLMAHDWRDRSVWFHLQ
jgi:MOSC domain-containing protein YiiM